MIEQPFFLKSMAFFELPKKGEGKTSIARKNTKREKSVDPYCLQHELEQYRRRGVSLNLEGQPSSPYEIVQAHLVAEKCGYMRDYVQNKKGEIQEIDFDKIRMD